MKIFCFEVKTDEALCRVGILILFEKVCPHHDVSHWCAQGLN